MGEPLGDDTLAGVELGQDVPLHDGIVLGLASGLRGAAGGAGPEGTVLTGTGPESTVQTAASDGGGAGLRPAGAAVGRCREG